MNVESNSMFGDGNKRMMKKVQLLLQMNFLFSLPNVALLSVLIFYPIPSPSHHHHLLHHPIFINPLTKTFSFNTTKNTRSLLCATHFKQHNTLKYQLSIVITIFNLHRQNYTSILTVLYDFELCPYILVGKTNLLAFFQLWS